jgi:hypothetical protein
MQGNVHISFQRLEDDAKAAIGRFVKDLESTGHEILNIVYTDDTGPQKLLTSVVKDAADVAETVDPAAAPAITKGEDILDEAEADAKRLIDDIEGSKTTTPPSSPSPLTSPTTTPTSTSPPAS